MTNTTKDYLEIKLETTTEFDSDKLEEALFTVGALSVSLTSKADEVILIEPIPGEMPLWEQGILVTGLFDKGFDPNIALATLKGCLGVQSLPLVAVDNLADKAWELEWTKFFHPIPFGEHLWVCPSNKRVPEDKITPKTQIITLDPGLAFGTGTHPTTAMVLEYIATNNNVGLQVIDYGCGSGILGIAAIKMGAKHAAMVDIDPQALATTQSNATINHVFDSMHCYLPDELPELKADRLIANILLTPLLQLKDTFAKLCQKDATILLTGLLSEQETPIIEAYQTDFYDFSTYNCGDWCLVVAKKT